jgi:hypothetical protein
MQAVLEQVPVEETLKGSPKALQRGALQLLAGIPWALGSGTWDFKSGSDAAATAARKLVARPSLLKLVTPELLGNMLWGLSRLRIKDASSADLLLAFRVFKAHEAPASTWANVVYAMGRLKQLDTPLFEQAMSCLCGNGARSGMQQLKVTHIARLAVGASALEIKDEYVLSMAA